MGAGGRHRAGDDAVSLREHIESRLMEMDRRFQDGLAAQDKAVQIAMIASEKAVVKAEVAAEKRFEATNEFRGQLADQAATFMPRVEAEQRMAALAEKTEQAMSAFSEKISDLRGSSRVGAQTLWGYLAGAAGLAVAIAAFFTR